MKKQITLELTAEQWGFLEEGLRHTAVQTFEYYHRLSMLKKMYGHKHLDEKIKKLCDEISEYLSLAETIKNKNTAREVA